MADENDTTVGSSLDTWNGQVNAAFVIRKNLCAVDYYDVGSLKLEQAEAIVRMMRDATDEATPTDALLGILDEASMAFAEFRRCASAGRSTIAEAGACNHG